MDFQLTEDQRAIQTLARDFAEKELFPKANEWDEQAYFPREVIQLAAQLGFAGLFVAEHYAGSGLTRLDGAIIFEELARACPSTAAYISIHNMVAGLLNHYASDEVKKRFLPALCNMELFSSYCLTEPNAGSDAASLKTTAKRQGDYYLLNGAKAFISGGSQSDLYLVMARTGENGHKGISCFIVEKDTPGLGFGKKEQKLGWRSQPTTMVFFENCKIPASNLIGDEGQGFKIALNALNGGRINIAACSLGGAKACVQFARQYSSERQQFQQNLNQFQSVQFKLADMLTQLEAARLMTHRAAHALDHQHPEAPMYCAMAKRLATDNGFTIVNDALQLYGGYGYLRDYPIERYFRDLRVHQILEGTNEIMRVIIAKRLLQEDFAIH